jgi:hypothetical protein
MLMRYCSITHVHMYRKYLYLHVGHTGSLLNRRGRILHFLILVIYWLKVSNLADFFNLWCALLQLSLLSSFLRLKQKV